MILNIIWTLIIYFVGDPSLLYKNLNLDKKWKFPNEFVKSNAEGFIVVITLLNPVSRLQK